MSSESSSGNEKHNAIEKALAILGLFAFDNEELGTIEISRTLGYHKATTSRTLIVLADYGFLEQSEETRKYKLGPRIVDLGLAITRSLKHNLIQIAIPHLEDLRDRLQETVVLELLSGKSTMTGWVAEGPSPFQMGGQVGGTSSPFITAGWKAILAFSPHSEWDDFLSGGLVQRTANSITDPKLFKEHLEKIRSNSVAIDNGENDIELNAMSAPVLNIEGKPIAAVTVRGLAGRIGASIESPIALELKKTADIVSRKLYHSNLETSSLSDWLSSIRNIENNE